MRSHSNGPQSTSSLARWLSVHQRAGSARLLEPRNLARAYREILSLAGLHHVRIHDLRHMAETLLLIQGVHPRVVMGLPGHSQIAVTMRHSHTVPALRKEAAEQMDAVLKTPEHVATTVAFSFIRIAPKTP